MSDVFSSNTWTGFPLALYERGGRREPQEIESLGRAFSLFTLNLLE